MVRGLIVEAKLNEFDKAEWFDVARKLKPDLTPEEYDLMWDDFQRAKAEHERTKGLQ